MNIKITDGHYDQSLAVKCINGTFVGKKSENVITYKGIPFVDKQPVGDLRWKAPVEYTPNDRRCVCRQEARHGVDSRRRFRSRWNGHRAV